MAGMNRNVWSSGKFTTLVGRRKSSYDPSLDETKPPTTATADVGVVSVGNRLVSGQMRTVGSPVVRGASGQLTVLDNNFTTGIVQLMVGDYLLLAEMDYDIGVDATATAANIAAAITRLAEEFSATSAGPVVTITATAPNNIVEFWVMHRDTGGVVNLGNLSPDDGFFTGGSPKVGE